MKDEKKEKILFDKPQFLSDALPPITKWHPSISNNSTARKKWNGLAQLYIRAFLAEGYTREEILNYLGIDDKRYDSLERELLDVDGSKFIGMGTAHRYYLYMLQQENCIRQLDHFIQEQSTTTNTTNKSSVVSAIKAKSQIYKDLIIVGQELGIVDKRAKELRVLGELNLSMMDTDELTQLYQTQLEKFENIIEPPKQLPGVYDKLVKNATSEEKIIDIEYEDE